MYVDAYSDKTDNNQTYENIIFDFSFMDSNLNRALELYQELFSVPNFFDMINLNQIIKQESVKIANEITNNSLDYAMSYAASGVKDYKKTYESFKADMFICNLGSEILKTTSPKDILNDVGEKLYILHNMIFRKDALSSSLHGNKKYLESVTAKLSLLLNAVKNENDIFSDELNDPEVTKFEEKQMKTLIKTPAQVSECTEVFKIPAYNHEDYPKCVIMANLMALNILHKEIREKGGAYGSGASLSETGLCILYSYRDPKPERSYKVFEKATVLIKDGKFTEQDIKEAKIFTFSRVDQVVNPANKGINLFLRGLTEEDRNVFRNRLLNVTMEDIQEMSKKYFIPQLEDGTTSRAIFGNPTENNENAFDESWEVVNSLDFLSDAYFKEEETFEN